ncbi:MAG: GntR family transcriptional regulator [Sediminibacterium sp.]
MKFNTSQAIYIQIAEMVCEKVLLGQFKEEKRIPSAREMAMRLGVNPNTVMHTFEFLQSKDIITNKRGIGYFVTANGKEKASLLRKDEFLQNELPQLFKTALLLNIPFEEIQELFASYRKKINNK